MSLSLKAELDTWAAALKAYDEENFDLAIELFSRIADTSKILTNMGLIYATLGMHEIAVQHFMKATGLDQYLAIAYFQSGVSNFLLRRYELSYKDFEDAMFYLRGNPAIDYEQIGLKFKLFSAEVLFNRGLSLIYQSNMKGGMADLEQARREKVTLEHNVIDDAIKDRGEGYTVFSIPVGILYRPSEKKLKNSSTKDYMGKAILVASSDPNDSFTTFTGSTRLKLGISPSGIYVERPGHDKAEGAFPSSDLVRSATFPLVSEPMEGSRSAGAPGVERAKTIGSNPNGVHPGGGSLSYNRFQNQHQPASLAKNNSTYNGGRLSPKPVVPGRSTSLRRMGPQSPQNKNPSSPPKEREGRMSEFYDGYLDGYDLHGSPPPLPNLNSGYNNTSGTIPRQNLSRNLSRSNMQSNTSQYGSSTSFRQKMVRRNRPSSRSKSNVIEDEGYVSGDYDECPFELSKIRIKLYYQDDVRGMTLHPETPFNDFMVKITSKFGKSLDGLGLKFKDEDNSKITLKDESDYELAIETAREISKGRPEGKLELWCTDIGSPIQ